MHKCYFCLPTPFFELFMMRQWYNSPSSLQRPELPLVEAVGQDRPPLPLPDTDALCWGCKQSSHLQLGLEEMYSLPRIRTSLRPLQVVSICHCAHSFRHSPASWSQPDIQHLPDHESVSSEDTLNSDMTLLYICGGTATLGDHSAVDKRRRYRQSRLYRNRIEQKQHTHVFSSRLMR